MRWSRRKIGLPLHSIFELLISKRLRFLLFYTCNWLFCLFCSIDKVWTEHRSIRHWSYLSLRWLGVIQILTLFIFGSICKDIHRMSILTESCANISASNMLCWGWSHLPETRPVTWIWLQILMRSMSLTCLGAWFHSRAITLLTIKERAEPALPFGIEHCFSSREESCCYRLCRGA